MFCRMHKASEKGFTLVELLVVIGIIGILALLLLPQFRSMRDRARVASCQSNLKNLGTQLEVEYVDNDSYPHTADWNALVVAGAALGKLGYCPLGPIYDYQPSATATANSGTTADTFSGEDDTPATITTYVAACTEHDGSSLGTPDDYPECVQLYVTPEGVVKRQ